ncbi:MAG: hypothetical protein GF320_04125 [Armatimonadia bacterium]|nr:hypothetical protein [Armatimonadia bacterium]
MDPMIPRERQLAAIEHEEADRPSVDVICIEIMPELAETLGVAEDQVYEALGIDGRIVGAGHLGPPRQTPDGQLLSEWGTGSDWVYSHRHQRPLAGAESVADVEAHPWPDPDWYGYDQAAKLAATISSNYAVRGPTWMPIACRVFELFGVERALMHLAGEPAVFEAAARHVHRFVRRYSERLLDACGDHMPIYSIGDDFATQRGLMISPDAWRRVLKPLYADLFEMARQRGRYVWLHSCGDITAVLPDLIDIGMDVWETVQLHTLPIDAHALKREYGRDVCFFGGINTQRLPFATPDEIRREVDEVMRALAPGGGFICGPDHHIKPDVPAERAIALFRAATSEPR